MDNTNSFEKLNFKGTYLETNDSVAVFQDLGEVQIDFIEMGRQCNRIEELGEQVATQIEALVAAVSALAALVGRGSSISLYGLNNLSNSVKSKVSVVTRAMQSQIHSYQTLNSDIGSKLDELMLIVEQISDGNSDVMYVKNNSGEIMSYNEAYDIIKNGFTPTKHYDMTNLAKLIRLYEIGDGSTVTTVDSNGVECYKVIYDSDGKTLAVGPGLQLDANGLSYKPDGTRYAYGDLISKEYIDNVYAQKLATDYRQVVENTLNQEKYSHLNLNDAQIDSITSLCYNTQIGYAEKYLDKLVEAQNNNVSFYDYYTSKIVYASDSSGNLVWYKPLAMRREGENVLFEQGYDAYKTWYDENYPGLVF